MRRILIISGLLWIPIIYCFSQTGRFPADIYDFLENPAVFELNQEEGHTPLIPYNNTDEALAGKLFGSPNCLLLNGLWKFFYSDTPEGVPEGFYKKSFNDRNWKTIRVPSNWEMEGFGDPLFRNVTTPFRPDPPKTPREYNPTGIYRKSFTLPGSWKDREIFLRMEKTVSASFVWINGNEVGYNEGGQEPAEYRITGYLKPGKNTIAVAVYKYSDGYYLENQDYWRLAGIFDDIWLFAAPGVHIFDWYATTDLDENYTDARLDLSVTVKNYSEQPAQNFVLKSILYDSEKRIVKLLTEEPFSVPPGGNRTLSLSEKVENPLKWSAEHPDLYFLTFELVSQEGKTVEVISGRIGFRETEIKDQIFYLNGKPVKLNGINSHMQHPVSGHRMDEATIKKDMSLLKQFNINCVRTSHYPPVNKYLDLADEYGLYIVDETGDEAHATEYLSSNKAWEGMYRERARKMVLRDRNHPSVLLWSAGNESGEGDNICSVIEEGKKYDHTRYWMYGGNAFSHKCEDIIGPRYPRISELLTRVYNIPADEDPRPSFLDEYLAVTGNGGGGLDDYWRLFYSYPRSMGGAIWDFVSTGITEKIVALNDASPNKIQVNAMGRAKLVKGINGKGVDLNGHDQWIEVYRDDALEKEEEKLTLSLWVYPRSLSSSAGTLITKGSWQYGINQVGKDSLEFYVTTRKKQLVRIALPLDWEYNWHHVTAHYNGSEIFLTVDGRESRHRPLSGKIRNTPFPVNIGRNAEIHGQETDVYICDAIIDEAGIFADDIPAESLKNPSSSIKERSLLWLDFEEMNEKGEFYSYGIGARTYGSIWPDRRPQPEMWQIKKSAQPVDVKLSSADNFDVEIINRHLFTNLIELNAKWYLQVDGDLKQQGDLLLDIGPQQKKIVSIPVKKPELKEGSEYRLLLSFLLKDNNKWANKGHEIAWEQIDLPWSVPRSSETAESGPAPRIKETAGNLIITGNDFAYVLDKKSGTIASMSIGGKELVKKINNLNIWRAPLANETDEWNFGASNIKHVTPGFGHFAATEWYSSGIDRLTCFPGKLEFENTGGSSVRISAQNTFITANGEGSFITYSTFTIDGSGTMEVETTVIPDGKMPAWLPRIGQEWILDKSLGQVSWYGRGPQENYPDRKSGYRIGVYRSTVDGMYEPYLIPQDYGLRTDNRWLTITDTLGKGFEFIGDRLFNFNIYPFSTENLTKAQYTYQLHSFDGITLNIDYATSGVGCTALGVFPEYQVLPQRYDFKLTVKPLIP